MTKAYNVDGANLTTTNVDSVPSKAEGKGDWEESSEVNTVDKSVIEEASPFISVSSSEDTESDGETVSEEEKAEEEEKSLSFKHILLIVETFFISLAVSYTEVCIVPAFPLMSEQWNDHIAFVPWVLSSFNMVGAVSTSIFGYFSGIYGPKYPIIISFVVYALGQLGCGLANSVFLMIAFRAVQGVGMSLYVLFYSAVKVTIPKKYVPVVIGLIETNTSVGTAVGLVGGALTIDNIPHWQDVFWTTLPVIVVFGIAFIFTFSSEENKRAGVADRSTVPPFDFVGPILLSIGLVLFLASFTLSDTRGWDALVISFLVIGVVLIIAFGVYEYMIDHPLIPIKCILTRDIGIAMAISFFVGMISLSVIQVTPYLLLSPENKALSSKKMVYAGLLMLPFGVVELIAAPIIGSIGRYVGFPICACLGTFFQCASLVYLIFLHHGIAEIIIGFILYGGTSGAIYVATMNMISEFASPHLFSILSGAFLLFNVMGSAVGPVVVDLISRTDMYYGSDASDSLSSSVDAVYASDKGYTLAFVFIAGVAGVEFLSSLFLNNKLMYCSKGKNKNVHEDEESRLSENEVEFDVVDTTHHV